MISSPYLLIMGVWPVSLFPCVADARQVLVLFQLCGLFAFGVLSWSTTQESLVSITCLLANFEVSFFFVLICEGEVRSLGEVGGLVPLHFWQTPSEASHSTASVGD